NSNRENFFKSENRPPPGKLRALPVPDLWHLRRGLPLQSRRLFAGGYLPHGLRIGDAADIYQATDLGDEAFHRLPVGAAVHLDEVQADLQRDAVALVLPVEGGAEGGIGALLEGGRAAGVLDAGGMADEKVVVHGDDRPLLRALGDERQAEMDDTGLVLRRQWALRHRARVIGKALGFFRREKA